MLIGLGEAKAKSPVVKVTGIPARRLPQAQQAALMRVHLYLIGRTHELLSEFASKARATILEYAGEDGILDAGEAARAQQALLAGWQESYMDKWLPLFQALRKDAASIPFGALAARHERYFSPRNLGEAKASPVFEPQLQALIDAANQRLYGDGLTLSSRIWKLDRETRQGINRVLMDAIVNGRSAWDTAKDLESFLGANQDCPRWTSTRLYKLSKKDIASGVRTGLKTGEECQGQGVAYKALRLARNEIQVVHHEASDRVMAAQPWVEKEQIVLSPQHPVPDICDEVIAAGEGGKGIYPVGEITLPLHISCLCFKITVMQPEKEFIDRLRSWMGGGSDSGMDEYAAFIGARNPQHAATASLLNDVVAQALGVWLFGGKDQLEGRLGL